MACLYIFWLHDDTATLADWKKFSPVIEINRDWSGVLTIGPVGSGADLEGATHTVFQNAETIMAADANKSR